MDNPTLIKKAIFDQCMSYINDRIQASEQAIKAAQEAAGDDTKSSAGDKYETGREMMQQEIDRHQKQLGESRKLRVQLDLINPETAPSETVAPGSLVETNIGMFYISISKGQVSVAGKNFYAISPASPLGLTMLRQVKGAQLSFNGKPFRILEIYYSAISDGSSAGIVLSSQFLTSTARATLRLEKA